MSMDIASFDMEKNFSSPSGGRSFNRLKVPKNGTVVVRVLPAYGTGNNGYIYSKHTVHWGFTDADGNARPVACSYPSERYCPVCDMVRQARSETDELRRQGVDSGNRYEQLKKTIDTMSPKTFYLFNVIDLVDGQVKMLELPKTAARGRGQEISPNSLLGKIKEAFDKRKIDSVSLTSGAWLEVSRSGEGLNTIYSVDLNRITKLDSEGNEVESINRTPIEESTLSKIVAQLKGNSGPMYDIHTMYEPRTSLELKSFIDGAPVPNKPKKQTATASLALEEEDDVDMPRTAASTVTSSSSTVSAVTATATVAPAAAAASGASGVQSEIQRLREKAKLKNQNGG